MRCGQFYVVGIKSIYTKAILFSVLMAKPYAHASFVMLQSLAPGLCVTMHVAWICLSTTWLEILPASLTNNDGSRALGSQKPWCRCGASTECTENTNEVFNTCAHTSSAYIRLRSFQRIEKQTCKQQCERRPKQHRCSIPYSQEHKVHCYHMVS